MKKTKFFILPALRTAYMGKAKQLLTLLFALLIIQSALFIENPFVSTQTSTSTTVSGTINQDTIWTRENSPYNITGNLTVNKGATLTVEPGVRVFFHGNFLGRVFLIVEGTLVARGTASDNIYFNGTVYSNQTMQSGNCGLIFNSSISWNPQTGSGSIIENADLFQTPIIINNCSPAIIKSVFHWNRNYPGSPEITGDDIQISLGTPLIFNNTFSSNTGAWRIYQQGKGFVPFFYGGTAISIDESNATIADNFFEKNGIAIDLTSNLKTYTSRPTIERNLISNKNFEGIVIKAPLPVTLGNNTIANSENGFRINAYSNNSIIKNNNIFGNSNSSIKLQEYPNNIDLSGNWWGTTDAAAINQSIYDFKNDSSLGTVGFTPFLTASNPNASPNPAAYTFVPSPTATPTTVTTPTVPELPITALLTLFILVLFAMAMLKSWRSTCDRANRII